MAFVRVVLSMGKDIPDFRLRFTALLIGKEYLLWSDRDFRFDAAYGAFCNHCQLQC
jgi:hypothetical protein